LLGFLPLPLHADPVATDNVEAQLVSEYIELAPGQTFWVALRQKIRPGWHTYWLNPGDSGLPTTIQWDLPRGFEAGDIHWPAPERIPVGPLMNFGYEDEVFLLTQFTAPQSFSATGPLTVRAHAKWLVCEEICIPEEADLVLNLLASNGPSRRDSIWAPLIDAAHASLPLPIPWLANVSIAENRFVLSVEGAGLVEPFKEGRLRDVAFFPVKDGLIKNAAEQVVRYGQAGFSVTTDPGFDIEKNEGTIPSQSVDGVLVLHELTPGQEDTKLVAFTLTARSGTVIAGTTSQVFGKETASSSGGVSLIEALLFALIGGLILNLMPCVLPILSMKAVSFVGTAQGEASVLRRNGLAYTLGIVVTFVVIAGILLSLRSVGEQLGWGYQLQSPVFVIVMAYVMFLVGLNLSGVYHVSTPLKSMGTAQPREEGLFGAFATGVLAVVVATPCTAPFMATALGFALVQPAGFALAIFVALGIGMALPYLVLTFSPALGRALPRPGAWMERFRQFLAFPMYGTAVWLVWVLTLQAGSYAVAAALAGMVLLAFAAWTFETTRNTQGGWWYVGRGSALGAVVIALSLLGLPQTTAQSSNSSSTISSSDLSAEAYSPERIAALRAEGRPVFVNFTAAWCITCLVNEQVVFNRPSLVEHFKQADVAYLKGDWTNRDSRITKALQRYGRSGVPLYLLYPPGQGGEEGAIVLPQILTQDMILSALDELDLMR
jgi:thiol:disulfide interchange protein DsbD